MIIKAFLEQKGMLVRGLAHPALFRERPGQGQAREVIFTEDQALFSSGFKTRYAGRGISCVYCGKWMQPS